MKKRIKKRMAKMVHVLCVAAMVGLTACSSAKPAETKAPETKAEAASEKEPAGEEPAVDYRITCNNGNQRTLINP